MDEFLRRARAGPVRNDVHDTRVSVYRAGMTDRTRIILIFAAVGLLCAGGAIYFFAVHQPASRLADAHAEIAAWDARWLEARTCLLGPRPASSKVSEALAVRELSPDPWERKTCTKPVSQLSRGVATDTRVAEVEAAWPEIDRAASRLAASFISHVDPAGQAAPGDAMRRQPDPLPVALDELEAAYAKLRAAAKLPPAPPPQGTAPLPLAAIVPIELDGARVLTLQDALPSRTGMLGFGTIEGSEIQLQLVAGKAPLVRRVGAGMQRAVPDDTWGARAVPDGVEIGAIDATGTMLSPTKLPLPGVPQVIAVIGTPANGVVVYGVGTQLVVARGRDGTFKPGKPFDVRSMAFATDAETGETVIAWTTTQEHNVWLHLASENLDAELDDDIGPTGYVRGLCLARAAAYLQTVDEGETAIFDVKLTDEAVGDGDADGYELASCADDGAIVRRRGAPSEYKYCVPGKDCVPFSIPAPRAVPTVALPDGFAWFRARGGVLAVRRPLGLAYYAVPNGFVPVAAMTNGGTLDLVGWTTDGLVIARLPAA